MSVFDKILKRRIIIGIHGLANKPPKDLLEKWWKMSIREGLATIGHTKTRFSFNLVYWADLVHSLPQDPEVTDKNSRQYLEDPYVPGNPDSYKDFTPSAVKKKLLDKLEISMDKMFFQEKSFINFDKFADLIIRNLFRDMDFYYHRDCTVPKFKGLCARSAIRARLADALKKYRNRDILLLAHSMGTIIAYDVLTQNVPDVRIHSLITMGSPLGIPVIRKKILMEQGRDYSKNKQAPSPENIRYKWYNFSDLDDPIALNYNLKDDYQRNSRGVNPEDVIIYNNYEYNRKRDPHKLYGYLRAPEVAKVIHEFCTSGRPAVMQVVKSMLGRLFE